MRKAAIDSISVYTEKADKEYIVHYVSGRKRTFYERFDLIPNWVIIFIRTGTIVSEKRNPYNNSVMAVYRDGLLP